MHVLPRRLRLASLAGFFAAAALVLLSARAAAQPFGAWPGSSSTDNTKYVEISTSPDLNPTDQITIEAWVINSSSDCVSFIGKDFTQAYWIGSCGNQLRSYLSGSSSVYTSGSIPVGQWTHIAVTYDGVNRKHYINGELVGTLPQTGPFRQIRRRFAS